MVRHMGKSPLVEVLGSLLPMHLRAKNHVKNTKSWGTLPVCALIQYDILREFQMQKIFTIEFPGICW